MAVFDIDETLAILDSLTLTILRLKEVYGTGTENYTTSKALKTNLDRVLDSDNFLANYLTARPIADDLYNLYSSLNNNYLPTLFQRILTRIYSLQDLNDFLLENDKRIHYELANIYSQLNRTIDPKAVMSPPIENAGIYEISDGSGTFTDGNSVDTTKYGKAFFKVKPLTTIGENDLTLVITCKKIDNTTEEKQVIVPSGSGTNASFFVGNGTTDMYVDIIDCSHTSGNNGDKVQFYTILERELNE